MAPLFILLGLTIAAIGFFVKYQPQKARTHALQSLAAQMNLPFWEKDSFGLGTQLQEFDLFRRERSRWSRKGRITNVIRSAVGDTDVYLFDYSYLVSTGKSVHRITQTVFFANDRQWSLPNFRLKPETWWHKVLGQLGIKKDINFEETPEFSEKYWLTGEVEGHIRAHFSPELRTFLTERPPTHIEGNNYYLVAYKPKKAIAPEQTKAFFEHCCSLVTQLQQSGGQELLQLAEIKVPEVIKNQ
jgi:hypothetical protein